jgi:hypothetical protein
VNDVSADDYEEARMCFDMRMKGHSVRAIGDGLSWEDEEIPVKRRLAQARRRLERPTLAEVRDLVEESVLDVLRRSYSLLHEEGVTPAVRANVLRTILDAQCKRLELRKDRET